MAYKLNLYLVLTLLFYSQSWACEFVSTTSCRPFSAILKHDTNEACCQGADCHLWDFVFDPSTSRKLIGEGSMGVVHAVTHPANDTTYVVKTFFPAPDEPLAHFTSVVQHEFDVSTRMRGPGFADTCALLTNDQGVHMISEYLQLPLSKILPYLDENDVHCIVSMLVQALHRMHDLGYAHRDVKPDNSLLTSQGRAKLIDLGESTSLKFPAQGYVGTPPYLAPEIYSQRQTGYDAALSDCWSLGVLILEMYKGQLPWMTSDADDPEFAGFILDPRASLTDLPEPVRDVVQGLLEVSLTSRWTINHVVQSGAFDGSTCDTDAAGYLRIGVNMV